MILDGWGISKNPEVSAVDLAYTPYMDYLSATYPMAQVRTDGMCVGLPEGQMGNSEVGHMNLGAGRIVYQDFAKINLAVENKTIGNEQVLKDTFAYAKKQGKKVHFLGLLSDGGVHSHINHLFGLLDEAKNYGLEDVFVHAFTDGRDVDPKSGKGHVARLLGYMEQSTGKLASVIGRYYAMDRDRRWERVKKAYDLLVHGVGTATMDAVESVETSYGRGVTDEFIEPIVLVDAFQQPVATIAEDDVVIFFNFRTDRGRQLTQALTQEDFAEFGMQKMKLYFVTMTNYDESFQDVRVIYSKDHLTQTLGEVLSRAGKTQLRIAETEKYPHVTFFFSGGREEVFDGEKRILCPSPKVATYDLQPEMSAYEIRDALMPEIKNKTVDFVCLNFANGDMVGHTGSLEAAIKACETVDVCVKHIVEQAIESDYTVLVLADHGNCEEMKNPDGSPHTAHTTNPVPLIVVDKDVKKVHNGILGDIAPTILHLMGVHQPTEMTQKSLIE